MNQKFREELYKKRFFRTTNPLLRIASNIIKNLDGTNEEKLGQFELIAKTDQFKRRYPGLMGKDVAEIIRLQLCGKIFGICILFVVL